MFLVLNLKGGYLLMDLVQVFFLFAKSGRENFFFMFKFYNLLRLEVEFDGLFVYLSLQISELVL
jgi:hypothetical protein